MRSETLACTRLRAGEPLDLSAHYGSARVQRASEGFLVSIRPAKAPALSRRFSDPSCAIHWAFTQIKRPAPTWTR